MISWAIRVFLLLTLVSSIRDCEGQSVQQSPNPTNTVSSPKTLAETGPEKTRAEDDATVKNRELCLTAFIALAAVVQAGVAFWQARIYRQQYAIMTDALEESRKSADAANRGIVQLEKIERPFLLVETRGDRGTEFWVKNCGKAPAQILYMRSDLNITYPEFDLGKQDWALPQPPYIGLNYDNPSVEQINVQWICPGGEVRFTYLTPATFEDLGEDMKAELRSYHRAIRIYSAIKYRGLVSDEIFESRFCYGWSRERGTYMTGSIGYNKYS